MLAKLLALIAQAKGATVVVVLVASAATATTVATNQDVQAAVTNLEANVGLTKTTNELATDGPGKHADACDTGQPEVVAQRNAADKLLRAAWQDAHKTLVAMHGNKGVDNRALGAVVKTYADQLKDTLDTALDETAALTLGRNGQNKSAAPSGSPAPTTSPAASPSAKPSCSPAPSGSPEATPAPTPTGSPDASASPEPKGRVAVAERTTLNADLQKIVDDAKAAFDETVQQATDEVAALPPVEHGKPSDKPDNANKPSKSPGRP